MSSSKQKVFLDANVVIQAGKPPGGPIMSRVADLVNAGIIKVLTTDLTVTEVAKKHTENDYEVIKEVGRSHFRKIVNEHTGSILPDLSKAKLKETISTKYHKQVATMFDSLKSKYLSIDHIKPSTVFTAYTEGSGFFTGEGKKDQFPDAFIFECLKAETSEKSQVIIVSNDDDFTIPVKSIDNISLLKTIPELFQVLGLQVDAPEIEQFLDLSEDNLTNVVDKELNDWGLQVSDVEDAEIEELSVTKVDLTDVISFGSIDKGGSILVVGTAEITATVSYTHPNWAEAMYDSEDKVLIPFDNVKGETEINLNADFSMSLSVDEEGAPIEIEDFRFRNSDFQYIELHPYDPYH
jgi:hypothetical protein